MNGNGCACAINQSLGDYFKSVRSNDEWDWDDMPTALAERREYNGYVIEQELDDYFSEVRGKEANRSEATKGGA